MTGFFRFPHTPHLAWLAEGRPRTDKVLTPAAARELLAHDVIVEEKVDGANLGFSVDEQGTLRAQNRGRYLSLEAGQAQWKPLGNWVGVRAQKLTEALFPNLMLFGEWCYAVHSVHYTRLPDWFLAFDVFDQTRGEFWSVPRRDAFLGDLDLAVVPRLASGRFDLAGLKALLTISRLGDGPAEGLYVRQDRGAQLVARAKLVRPEFSQSMDVHWSKRALRTNALRSGPDGN